MAISVGMGECPASPYLSLSLLSIPPLSPPPPPSSPSSFPPLYFSILPLQLFWLPTTYTPTHTHTPSPHLLFLSARIFRPLFPLCNPRYPSTPNTPPPTTTTLPLLTPSFSLRGCSSRCTLTARGYCVWKCSCWTRRPLQSTGQRLEHLCLRLGTFDLQRTLQTCHRS